MAKWPYNTKHWRDVRARVLHRDGRRCLATWRHHCAGTATEVHHIKAPAEGGHPFDPVNLLAVCRAANVAEKNRRRARWARIYAGEESGDIETSRPW